MDDDLSTADLIEFLAGRPDIAAEALMLDPDAFEGEQRAAVQDIYRAQREVLARGGGRLEVSFVAGDGVGVVSAELSADPIA
jgi:hypothetical protein